jgi:hypothetical protein
MGRLRKHPIAAFLPLQALLCFSNLGLMRAVGMRDPPAWQHELLEFRR